MRSLLPRTPGPSTLDVGLLLLRLGMGLSMAVLFGGPKLHDAWGYLHSGEWPFVDFNRKVGLPLPVLVAFLRTCPQTRQAFALRVGPKRGARPN